MKLITLAEKYNYKCYWCKKKFPLDELSRDHIIPLNKGRNRGKDNGKVLLSCIFCNQDRGNLLFEDYKWVLKNLRKHKKYT